MKILFQCDLDEIEEHQGINVRQIQNKLIIYLEDVRK